MLALAVPATAQQLIPQQTAAQCAARGGTIRTWTSTLGVSTQAVGECYVPPGAGGGGGGYYGGGNAGNQRAAAAFGMAGAIISLLGQAIEQSNQIADREYREHEAYQVERNLLAQRQALEADLRAAQYADAQRHAAAMDRLAERMKLAEAEVDRTLARVRQQIAANAGANTVLQRNPFARRDPESVALDECRKYAAEPETVVGCYEMVGKQPAAPTRRVARPSTRTASDKASAAQGNTQSANAGQGKEDPKSALAQKSTAADDRVPPGYRREPMMDQALCGKWGGRYFTPANSVLPVCDYPDQPTFKVD